MTYPRDLPLIEDPDPQADAISIMLFSLEHGQPPFGLTVPRCERAIALFAYSIRRRADESPKVIDTINDAIDRLVQTREAIRRMDNELPPATPVARHQEHAQARGRGDDDPGVRKIPTPKLNPSGPVPGASLLMYDEIADLERARIIDTAPPLPPPARQLVEDFGL